MHFLSLILFKQDVHEPPTDIQLNSNVIKENLEEGSPISNITVVDEDENTLVSCKILQDGKGRVSVNGTVLIAGKTAVDYEMEPSHILMISLKCCDQFKLCLKKNFRMEIKGMYLTTYRDTFGTWGSRSE